MTAEILRRERPLLRSRPISRMALRYYPFKNDKQLNSSRPIQISYGLHHGRLEELAA